MVEIAVDLMLIHNTAHYVNALKKEEEEIIVIMVIMVGLLMGFVMTSTTIKTVIMMVEIAVDLMLIHNTAQNLFVMNKFLSVNTQ